MQEGKTKSTWTRIKNAARALQNIGEPPIKFFKYFIDFVANFSEIIEYAPKSLINFIIFIGNIAHNPTVKIILGFITPILAFVDFICDIYETSSLQREARERLLLRCLVLSEADIDLLGNLYFDGNTPEARVALKNKIQELAQFKELQTKLAPFINQNLHNSFEAVKKHLRSEENKVLKGEFAALAKSMGQFDKDTVECLFVISNTKFIEDGEQDRKDFRKKYDKQIFRTYRNALIAAFAWFTAEYGVIKYAIELSALTKPAVPYLVYASLVLSYLSVITLIVFTIMQLGVVIKDFLDMYNGDDDNGREFKEEILAKPENSSKNWEELNFSDKWVPLLKFFLTKGFALELFSITGTSLAIIAGILLLVGIISAPVAGMITAAIFGTILAVNVFDIGVRKVAAKYNQSIPAVREPTTDLQKDLEVHEGLQQEDLTKKDAFTLEDGVGNTPAPTLHPGSEFGAPTEKDE